MNPGSEPLVTILVPSYARAGYAVEAVRSALAQDYRAIEVLVLDDASPDDTAEKLSPFRSDPRFRYVRHEKNLGITGNWRYGIGAARGQYFCLLHDDDTLEPDFVRSLLQPMLADPALALAFCDHSIMDQFGRPLPSEANTARFHRDTLPAGKLSDDAFARAVLVDLSVPVGASLFRRDAVTPEFVDARAQGAIDYWLLYRLLQTGRGAFYVNRRLMNYRAHGGGMSARSTLYMAEGHLFRLNAVLADPAFPALRQDVAALRRFSLTGYGIDLAQSGRRREARRALWMVLREHPSRRALVAFALSCLGRPGGWFIAKLRARGT